MEPETEKEVQSRRERAHHALADAIKAMRQEDTIDWEYLPGIVNAHKAVTAILAAITDDDALAVFVATVIGVAHEMFAPLITLRQEDLPVKP